MPSCPICNRSVIRLANHLRKIHQLYYKTTEPSTLKQFIQWLRLITVTPHDWEYIRRHRKELDKFCSHDQALPTKLFQLVYTNMERYKAMKGSKLVILENTLQSATAQEKPQHIYKQAMPKVMKTAKKRYSRTGDVLDNSQLMEKKKAKLQPQTRDRKCQIMQQEKCGPSKEEQSINEIKTQQA